jgi:hypothetical protein
VGDTIDMIRCVLRRPIEKVERERNTDASYIRNVIAAVAMVGGFGLAAPAAAPAQPAAVGAFTMTSGRILASGAAVVGLIGVVIGGLALARSAGRIGAGNGRRGAMVALVLGLIGLVIGGLVVATADGGVGSGSGIAGGIVAMAAGLIGMTLGGLARARSRRTA